MFAIMRIRSPFPVLALALAVVGICLCRSGRTRGSRSLLGTSTRRSLVNIMSSGIDDRHSDEVPGK
jgi:hypothetical protein